MVSLLSFNNVACASPLPGLESYLIVVDQAESLLRNAGKELEDE
jgi:hypothetical protein